MDVFLYNFNFIWFNSFLALVAVLFGWLMNKADSVFAKTWTGFIWLIFLPNTLYILTDVSHLFEDWPRVNNLFRMILILQYTLFSIFGIITFMLAVYFFQKTLERKNKKRIKTLTFVAIVALNFLVGFGVVLGGVERTNSWHIFTNPIRVINDVFYVIFSIELVILSLGVGILANIIYFLLVKPMNDWVKKKL
ncbi:MAG: DUF1361 domain-containing protein [Candidatus Levybacteria bacterium]|nr:DUF1361 domain-containing protein [Candidatus Levybacteria bacterium]